MEQVVEALRRVVRVISEGFEKQTSVLIKYLEPIRDLPRIIGEVRKDMVRGFSDVAKAQVMVAIAEQKGRYDARQELMQLEQEQISALAARLEEERERIHESAEKDASDVDADLHTHIEQMDGPLLDLGRELFPVLVHRPYSTDLVPGWQLLSSVRRGTAIGRNLILEHDLQRFECHVERYEEHCRTLREQADVLSCPSESVADTDVLIPVLFVEKQQREGSTKDVDIIVAPEVDGEGHLKSALPSFQKRIEENLRKKVAQLIEAGERIDLLKEAESDVMIDLKLARKLAGGTS